MAEKTRKVASMAPSDAEQGGSFQGGVTTIKKARFGRGYHEGKSEEIITLQLRHVPKAEPEPRIEYLSCGAKAAQHFKIAKDGTHLIPTSGRASIHGSTNAMIFLDSLKKAGFPEDKLRRGDMSILDGLVLKARQKPMKREGLDIEGGGDRPKTVLVAEKIVKLPWKKTAEADESEPEEEAAEEEEEAEEEAEEEEEEEESEEAEESEEESGEEAEEEEEEAEEEEEEAEESDVSDSDVLKHLKKIVKAAGGSVKKTKLGAIAFKALKSEKNRNAIVKRMVEDDLLKKAKKVGVSYSPKTGAIEL